MKTYQVVGIGNAIVDVLARAEDTLSRPHGHHKGIMQLVERERGEVLYGAMNDRVQAPGRLGRQHHGGAGQSGAAHGLHRPGA